MLTPEQEKWLAHLSDTKKIRIIPFDPTAEEKFQKIKQIVQDALGPHIPVEHHGATSLGISGQDEIDIYIPVPESNFDLMINPLIALFGNPGSIYPLVRARFTTELDDKHIDVFLINADHHGWIDSVVFETYLRSHSEALQAYRQLKEDGHGLSVQEYYRRKTVFINKILTIAGKPRNL
jgi:GrpB-like predicted nucleotidyltransferase (UPF0157 family)